MAASRLPAVRCSSIIASRGMVLSANSHCHYICTTVLHRPPAVLGTSTWMRRVPTMSFTSASSPRNMDTRESSPLLSQGLRSPSWGGTHECVHSTTLGSCRSHTTGTKRGYVKPTRSVLYTPGSSRQLYKIREIACDASLIDLEDGVAPEAKVTARGMVSRRNTAFHDGGKPRLEAKLEFHGGIFGNPSRDNASRYVPLQILRYREEVCTEVAKGGYGRRAVVVRINALDSPWGEDDIRAVANLPLDAVVMPKVENPVDVRRVADLLVQHGSHNIDLWCMIETPLGVMRVNEIASSHETLSCLVIGISDLSRGLQANHTPNRTPLLYSLSRCVLAARTYGLRCVDGVHLDRKDTEGFERACRQGRDMGMDGKTLLHPSNVAMANRFFGPNASEVEQAYRVMKAHEEAASRGEGCAVLDGSLVERLHAENARRIIELHESIGVLEKGQADGTGHRS